MSEMFSAEDEAALRALEERRAAAQAAAAAPAAEASAPAVPADPADPDLGHVPPADEVAEVPEAEEPHPSDNLPTADAGFEPAGAASFPDEVSGSPDGAGDGVPDPEPGGDGAGPASAVPAAAGQIADDAGLAVVGEPGAEAGAAGDSDGTVNDQFTGAPDAAAPGEETAGTTEAEPVMTAAEAQQSMSAAGAAALPPHMQVSQAVAGAGEPALPDSATSN